MLIPKYQGDFHKWQSRKRKQGLLNVTKDKKERKKNNTKHEKPKFKD